MGNIDLGDLGCLLAPVGMDHRRQILRPRWRTLRKSSARIQRGKQAIPVHEVVIKRAPRHILMKNQIDYKYMHWPRR